MLDSLKDECFYKIEFTSEKFDSKDRFLFMIGRAKKGFYVSGYSKQIKTCIADTTRKTYRRQKLETSQLDSLKQFELILISHSIENEYQDQAFEISTQAGSQRYAINSLHGWDGIKDLLLILFRLKE